METTSNNTPHIVAEEKWGSGVVEQLSLDLQEAFPKEKGFGTRNLWNMKSWYLYFASSDSIQKLHQLGAEWGGCIRKCADNSTYRSSPICRRTTEARKIGGARIG